MEVQYLSLGVHYLSQEVENRPRTGNTIPSAGSAARRSDGQVALNAEQAEAALRFSEVGFTGTSPRTRSQTGCKPEVAARPTRRSTGCTAQADEDISSLSTGILWTYATCAAGRGPREPSPKPAPKEHTEFEPKLSWRDPLQSGAEVHAASINVMRC
ncbi:hypothetical protein NDU88_001062 [Pleurodeles waltl]|uniref:Uncharacterized protein n=1 Tax=Pleurodeles waltl TaxID=8319 RepID=A0AAV7P4M9_PLEWA|nr:hypothetical protein NDU88_001062 [Pleurodeles waltl]